MAVGASQDAVRLNVAPEPERRKRQSVELSRISCVNAVNEWYPIKRMQFEWYRGYLLLVSKVVFETSFLLFSEV
jgi:hypothetical protein